MSRDNAATPSLPQLLRSAIRSELTELHVCMPGRIDKYDTKTGLATVKPTLARRFRGRTEATEYPVIPRVPVIQPRTAVARINFPVKPGDLCLLVFADRNIENWIASDGAAPKEVNDVRMHDLSDAYAILGAYPEKIAAPSKNPDALSIEVNAGTKIALTNGSVEILSLFDDILVELDVILTNVQALTVGGVLSGGSASSVPVNVATFAQSQTVVATLKEKLGQLKV